MKLRPPRRLPSKDERYMGLALWVASFSKDPDTQVGAVIVGADDVPRGSGYNGPPAAIDDDLVDWARPGKQDWVIHAEENAITHSHGSLVGSTIYVTAKPCPRCMLRIVRERVGNVIYFPLKGTPGSTLTAEAHKLCDQIAEKGNVKVSEFAGNLCWMLDRTVTMRQLGYFG